MHCCAHVHLWLVGYARSIEKLRLGIDLKKIQGYKLNNNKWYNNNNNNFSLNNNDEKYDIGLFLIK